MAYPSKGGGKYDRKKKSGILGFNPFTYIIRDTWRNRSRTSLSIAGFAALSFLFVLFSSMQQGLDEYNPVDDDKSTKEETDLMLAKEVLDKWIYLITVLCWTLMVLVVANTSGITVVERRRELATLRAIGLSTTQVSFLVIGGMALIIYSGIIIGAVLGIAFIPLLDGTNLAIWGNGIGFPFAFDWNTLLITLIIGTLSGIIGMIIPMLMIIRSQPAEVLTRAG